MPSKQPFITGVYLGEHFIAELNGEGRYICLPQYSAGNLTDVTFAVNKINVRFYDSIEDAVNNRRSRMYLKMQRDK
jgi:hypothetical protein